MSKISLVHARIFDGTQRPTIEDGLLSYEIVPETPQGVLSYVGSCATPEAQAEIAASDTVADLSGYTLLPGLFNCHVHLDLFHPFLDWPVDNFGPAYRALMMYRRLAETLMSGVTTIRNIGGADFVDVALRKAVDKNMLFGSRVIACGEVIIAHGGHGWNQYGSCECSGPAEFAKGVRRQIAQGVDFIKICMTGGLASPTEGVGDLQMTDAEIASVVEVAHGSSKRVAAHLSNDHAIRAAVRNGVDCVEHGYFLTRETAKMMKDAGTFYVPTIAVSHAGEYLMAHGSPEYQVRKQAEAQEKHKQALRWAVEEGLTIGVGTDLLPNDPLEGTTATIRETECLVESGMTPAEALRAATSVSARICGVEAITGTLAKGMQGDFIAVPGKPDEDITALRRIDLVAKGSRLAFSRVKGFEAPGFNVVAPGYELDGATMIKW